MSLPVRVALFVALCVAAAHAQASPFQVSVKDENGRPLRDVQVSLISAQTTTCMTDTAGACALQLPAGEYTVRADAAGFYVATTHVTLPSPGVDVTLYRLQEIKEQVEVTATPPPIVPDQTVETKSLGFEQVLELPYSTSREIRNAFIMLPQVVQDNQGLFHVAGAQQYQTLQLLDGFNVSHPATGLLTFRVSADAVHQIETSTTRYPADEGWASGGVLALTTGTGDDRFRFYLTNFIPSVQFVKGVNFDKFVPRFTFSGPIVKGKAWFYNALDGEYTENIVKALPSGADTNTLWHFGDLAKVTVKLARNNILTTTFLVNRDQDRNPGISEFTPVEATPIVDSFGYVAGVRDQHYFGGGALFEVGAALNYFDTTSVPLGTAPFVVHPGFVSGNFNLASEGRAHRAETYATLFAPTLHALGEHEFRVGVDTSDLAYSLTAIRRPIHYVRTDGTLEHQATFLGPDFQHVDTLEVGGYVEDHWLLGPRVALDPGVRIDWDRLAGQAVPEPRFAASWVLPFERTTKLSAGVGIYSDQTDLDMLARVGARQDQFFAADGVTPLGPPSTTTFRVDPALLRVARFLNWSVELEHQLPWRVYTTAEYIDKHGRNAPLFVNQTPGASFSGDYLLESRRTDHYHAWQLTARKDLSGAHSVFVAYTRSSATSNAVVPFTLDVPIFSAQAGGPVAWDAPNRLISWAWLPLRRRVDLGYFLDWHDGFPFSVFNNASQLVGAPNTMRFPDYFSLNVHVEYRFALFHQVMAVRGGFDNITGHSNPAFVDNNIDSPTFLAFSRSHGRAFTTRIRFLGRSKK